MIQLGDFCDWDSLTNFEPRRSSDIIEIETEVSYANELLDRLDDAIPASCEKVMIGGNHEARYERFKVNHGSFVNMRRLRSLTHWWAEYGLPERKWSWCEYGEWREYGKIIYTHGWHIGAGCAKKHLNIFHKNILFGHTHMFDVATGVGLDGKPVIAASIGTLSKFDLSYLVGKPPVNWLHMFAYIDTRADETFSIHFVPIVNGTFIEMGKEFDPLP